MRRRDLVLAGATAALARPAVAVAGSDDGEILLRLLVREESAQFAAERTPPPVAGVASHEADHAKALRTQLDALGRRRPPPPETAAQLDAPARRLLEAGTLDAWIELEASLLRDYEDAVIRIGEPSALRTAATILASHAQHHALVRRERS
jgi:hypothetical protein